MAQYICNQLATNSETGQQTCIAYVEYAPFFPDLTVDQTSQIAGSTAFFLAVCFIYRKLRSSV